MSHLTLGARHINTWRDIMKAILQIVITGWLALIALLSEAAMEQTDKLAPEPTVSVVWVVVFFIAFIAVCVGIGVGVYRAERASKAGGEKKD